MPGEETEGGARRPLIDRSFVEAMRRDHLGTVYAQLCFERGFHSVTVADLTRRAEVSRATFYQVFSGLEDCFTFLISSAAEELSMVVDDSAPPGVDREKEVLLATSAAFRWLAANEARASALLIDVHGGPSEASRRQLALFDTLADQLARARRGRDASSSALEEMLLGGTVGVLRRLVVDGEISRAPMHAEDLACLMARLPLIGS